MDSGAWQESPVCTGLAAGSTHTFYQTRILEDPYFLTDSVTSVTIQLPDHDWGEPVFDGMNKGTHTKTCLICKLDQTENCSGGTASYFQQAICTVCAGVYETYLTDTTAPTGSMQLGQNIWTTLLNTITFELFFHDAQTITIQATDDSRDHDGYTDDKAVKAAYFIHDGDAALTREELDEKSFVEYADAVSLTGNGKYTVYAKLTDWADNVTYLSSSGIVIYSDAEQITEAIAYTRTSMTDVSAQVKLNGNTIRAITLNGDPLEPDTDYTVDGGDITFKAGWLDALAEGRYTLIVSYDPQGKAYQDGVANELATAGSTNGGTMAYSLTEDGEYVETIPTGMNAGDYQVWYKVIGNDSRTRNRAVFTRTA